MYGGVRAVVLSYPSMATAIVGEQEKRNVWLSVYGAAIAGLTSSLKAKTLTEEQEEDVREAALNLADGGLEDFLSTFDPAQVEHEEEPDEDDDESEDSRGRRRRPRR